jgi:hypothetical protein
MRVSHTGGNYMTDGMGIGASTQIVYEESLSQLGVTAEEVDQKMNDYLGIHTYHVVEDPNNTYIDHIDCWAKFLDVDKILIREVPSWHPQYDEIEATAAYFAAQTSSYNTAYEIYRVNTPEDQPYTNSLIVNDHVFVPVMGTSYDAAALAVYEAAMPGYTITGVLNGTTTPWESTDALHCRTRGTVDKEMLHIYHVAQMIDRPSTGDYDISAKIVSYGGHTITSAILKYSVNGGAWNTLNMTEVKGMYSASIPNQASGSEISYYIQASDNSGRIENHPFIGEPDPHKFTLTGGLDAPSNIVVVSATSSSVELSWDAVSGASFYNIYRSSDPYSGFSQAGTSSTNNYTDSDILTAGKYFYYITASDGK